ncbi:MAG: PQQ-binding-like beta-propeller repeat protein [Pirellulales bacterium]
MRLLVLVSWIVALAAASGCRGEEREPSSGAAPGGTRSGASGRDGAAAAQSTDWPGFLGPTADSKSTQRGILTRWPADGPPLVWQLSLGTGYCMPAIADGRLYQFDRADDSARLRCLDSRTGKAGWTFEYSSDFSDLYGYDNGPRSSPVVDEGRVYIFGAEGMLHCLDTADGKVIWKVDTAATFGVIQNFFGVGSTPVVAGDLLLVPVGGSPPESKRVPPGQLDRVVGNGSGIVAFDKRTGAVKYQMSDELASYATPKLATIAGRRWCFWFARGGLVGFDPTTGKADFHFPWRAGILESVNASDPVVVNDLVFISEAYGPGGALLRVKPGSATPVWTDAEKRRDKSMQTHWNTPVHHEGYLYASSGRHTENAELRCIELVSGKVQWAEPGLTRSSLLYVDGHFVCLSEDGMLRLVRANPRKYEPVAEVALRGAAGEPSQFGFGPPRLLKYPAWAAPILSHGLLYVRGVDRLVCLELIPGSAGGAGR